MILKGFVPHGIHRTKGLMYFSRSRQKWVRTIEKLKISDILSTPTVPIKNPNKIMKNIMDVGVSKIKIKIKL